MNINSNNHASAKSIIASLKAAYHRNPKKKFDQNDSFISRYIYRVLSLFLAVPFVRLGFSANQVTALSFSTALAGIAFLLSGTQPAVILGSIIWALSVILDYVDGNIARLHGKTNHFGKFLDGMAGTIVNVLLPIAVAIGLANRPDKVLADFGGDPAGQVVILVLGALTALAICLQSLVSYRFRLACFEAQVNIPGGGKAASSNSQTTANYIKRMLYGIRFCLKTEAYFMLTGIILFAALDILSIYIMVRFFARSLDCLMEVAKSFVQARSLLAVYREF